MERISTTDLRQRVADVVNRVGFGGERVELTRHGKTVAVLVPPGDVTLLELLERRIDLIEARRLLARGDDSIPAEEVWKSLGIAQDADKT